MPLHFDVGPSALGGDVVAQIASWGLQTMPTGIPQSEDWSRFTRFVGGNLTEQIKGLEQRSRGKHAAILIPEWEAQGVELPLLRSLMTIKKASGQIDTALHAATILAVLPHVMEEDETVLSLSLGAGNSGRSFDVETSHRVAEFTLIAWRGGAETIRQNRLFWSFYRLVRHDSPLLKELYLLDGQAPRRFLTGGRAISSIFKRNQDLGADFDRQYGAEYRTVGEFYHDHEHIVKLVDLSEWLPGANG